MGADAAVESLPREYGYVVLVLVSYCFLNLWIAAQVGKPRIKYNVPYPTMYATEAENKDAKLFNCVQVNPCAVQGRGHQNSFEMMPMFLLVMILGGIRHPLVCASLGVVYHCTFSYFKVYSTGDPQKRLLKGRYGFVALLGLMLSAISCGVEMLIG